MTAKGHFGNVICTEGTGKPCRICAQQRRPSRRELAVLSAFAAAGDPVARAILTQLA